jgi:ParB family chromosome partitioning protein
MAKKKALGRGLGALLESQETDITSRSGDQSTVVGSIAQVKIEDIDVNPFQPRTEFERDALIELANSIKEHGIIQPITLRKNGYGKYQIISGERRFRASQVVGLTEIPAYIRIANDQAMLEMAIVENVQRQDLNPIEVAISFQRLLDECSLTQEELGEKVSKSRSAVTNYLRLLNLPDIIQIGLKNNELTMGHARALLGVKDENELLRLYNQVIEEKLSVRKTEELVKGEKEAAQTTPLTPKPRYSLSYEEQKKRDYLSAQFDTPINIKKDHNGTGKIVIPFQDQKHLKEILALLEK